jgi:8-oxo-dGTP pyrophosphatase MutT (NUDIX family)
MAIPEFIRELRATAGHGLLLLPCVSAVVLDDTGRVLLGRRADDGRWDTPGGIPEPGEEPAAAAVREVHEETGVRCTVERLLLVRAEPEPVTYPNGDRCQFMETGFACRATGGVARVNDDESLEVGWFAPGEFPPLAAPALFRIGLALSGAPVWFRGAPGVPAPGEPV